MTNVSLVSLNCHHVRFAEATGTALPEGYAPNSAGVKLYDFVLVDPDIINRAMLADIREQHPTAKVRLLPGRG